MKKNNEVINTNDTLYLGNDITLINKTTTDVVSSIPENLILEKQTALIYAMTDYNLLEYRFLNIVIALIDKVSSDLHWSIDVNTLYNILYKKNEKAPSLKRFSSLFLKEFADEVLNKKISVSLTDENSNKIMWKTHSCFSEASYKDSIFTVRLTDAGYSLFSQIQPGNYCTFLYKYVKNINSIYALRAYELIQNEVWKVQKKYLNARKFSGSLEYSVKEFLEFFGKEENKSIDKMSYVKTRIAKPIQDEINKNTLFNINTDVSRVGYGQNSYLKLIINWEITEKNYKKNQFGIDGINTKKLINNNLADINKLKKINPDFYIRMQKMFSFTYPWDENMVYTCYNLALNYINDNYKKLTSNVDVNGFSSEEIKQVLSEKLFIESYSVSIAPEIKSSTKYCLAAIENPSFAIESALIHELESYVSFKTKNYTSLEIKDSI